MTQSLTAEEIAPASSTSPAAGAITDDHYGTSILTKTQEELEACDFLPFSSGIASGAPFVMVSHLSVPRSWVTKRRPICPPKLFRIFCGTNWALPAS